MNRRIINSIISKKFKSFLDSIEDEKVKELVSKNSIITGGCIASMFLKEKVNDYDIYLRDAKTTLAVTKHYVDMFNKLNPEKKIKPEIYVSNGGDDKPYIGQDVVNGSRIKIVIKSVGISAEGHDDSTYQYFETRPEEEGAAYVEGITQADEVSAGNLEGEEEKPKFRPVFLSGNAITLSNKVQIVIRFYGEPEEIHENYDFVHCTNYWDSKDGKIVIKSEALESLLTKQLFYVGSKYPLCSVIRLRKFIKRGWHINAGQILKMLFQVSELDLTDIDTLEDQLTGMDTAYFLQVIEYLKKRQEEDKEFKVTLPYLTTIIDKIF